MARPRRYPFRRPPPPADPYAYERTVEETMRPRARTPFETLWFWLALIGVVLLAAVVVLLLVRDDEDERRAPRAVALPAVVGADHVEAADTLERLDLVVTTSPVAGPDPAGRVTEQEPTAGTRVRRGGEVILAVSTGTVALEPLPVPDVTGAAAPAGRDTVRRAGFTVRTVYRDAPSADDVGEVLDQEPPAGTEADPFSQVTVFVGR